MRPKTIEAYTHALRRAGSYFNFQINDLTEAQLTEYFSDLLITHSWSTLKHDLYGLKFYYDKVLHKDWPAPNLVKAPTILTVGLSCSIMTFISNVRWLSANGNRATESSG